MYCANIYFYMGNTNSNSSSGNTGGGGVIDNTSGEMTTGSTNSKNMTTLNIIIFALVTLLYYVTGWKKKLMLDDVEDEQAYKKYQNQNYFRLFSYFVVVMLIQFWINIGAVNLKCGGSASKNMNIAAYWTFVPWIFIFGVMMIALVAFPGFKSAFSNIFGYGWISSKANTLLAELLVEKRLNVDKDPQKGGDPNDEDYKEAIVKLFGNMSILVNKIVPDSFNDFWQLLVPVMKPGYITQNSQYETAKDTFDPEVKPKGVEDDVWELKQKKKRETSLAGFADLRDRKQQLLDMVVSRDNIGEAFWYSYTAILVMTMVQYFISTSNCNKDPEAMQKEYAKFQAEEQAKLATSSKSGKIQYTV